MVNIFIWSMCLLAIPGIVMNLLVCLLSFHPLVSGDYKWFIFHLAVLDILYSISNMYYSAFVLFPGWVIDELFCEIDGFMHWYCVMMSVVALLPVTFNRLCSLSYEKIYGKISTPFGILATFGLCDISSFLLIIMYPTISGGINRGPDGTCDFVVATSPMGMAYGALLLCFSPAIFGILVYMNWRIFRVVRSRKENRASLGDINMSAQRETNSIIRATVIQAIVPMFVQVPFLVMTGVVIARFTVPDELRYFLLCLHSFNPIANVLITFIVVRSYNRAFRTLFGITKPSVDATTTPRLGNNRVKLKNQNANFAERNITKVG